MASILLTTLLLSTFSVSKCIQMQKDRTTAIYHYSINIMFTTKKEMEGRKQ